MIKYLGSKRTLVPVLGELAVAAGARTAVDLFTGTTRVAQELKRRGVRVTATDLASYSAVRSDCFVATDADAVDLDLLDAELARLAELPGHRGYFTETFCEQARFLQPRNGMRVDAVRDGIERDHPPLLGRLRAEMVVASYNDESWISTEQMTASLRDAGHAEVALLAFDRKRYVGATIGIHNRAGERVGEVGRLRNVEYLFVAGAPDRVEAALGVLVIRGAASPSSARSSPPRVTQRSPAMSSRPSFSTSWRVTVSVRLPTVGKS